MTSTPTGLQNLKYKTIGGLKIRYATNDKTSGEPILMLSPLPESILAFLPIWDSISELGPVIAVDIPPFGRSEVDKDARTPEPVGEFVLSIMEAFDFEGNRTSSHQTSVLPRACWLRRNILASSRAL